MAEPVLEPSDDPRDVVRAWNEVAASHPTALLADSGAIAVLRHDDVERLAHDQTMVGIGLTIFDFLGIGDGPLRRWYGSLMFTNEGEVHHRQRRLVARAFTPRSVERLRHDTTAMVAGTYDRIESDGGGDLVAALRTVPMRVMGALLGVPDELVASFVGWADALSPTFGLMTGEQIDRASVAIVELLDAVSQLVADLDARGADDDSGRGQLLVGLLEAEHEGDRLTRDETVDMVANLLVGGHDTTGSQIGCTLVSLLGDADARRQLDHAPDLAPSAVWETLRHEPSIIAIPRLSTVPREVGGVERPAGTLFMLSLASANRDPVVWPDPDRLVVDRFVDPEVPKPLSFGTGAHYCLGAHMARMTLDEVVAGLAGRPFRLVDDPNTVPWKQVLGRSPASLVVRA